MALTSILGQWGGNRADGVSFDPEIIKDVDLIKDYSKDVDAPYYFTNIPGEVHRAFSLEDYTAYEVSTPELDDVIRIQDDSGRKSGKIIWSTNILKIFIQK